MTDLHTLTGAYAIDAVDDVERADFERHLAGCEACRDEVAELQATAALLCSLTETSPPDGLRQRVLADVATVRPLPPVTETRRPRRGRRLGLMVAAAVAVVAGGVGIAQPWHEQVPISTQVIEASDVTKHQLAIGPATATVYRSRSVGRAVLVTRGLPAPPAGKVYEMWLQNAAGVMEPAGLMSHNGTVTLKGDARAATAVGITVEPVGGSDAPTSKPVAIFDLGGKS